ncbi:uncharacterized protein [Rutidosis leptorrhynchoides]|uniref:uncharacterized protein n=1 Tax=Rutidosis leptorrhynchoides TaxID=125765 RepID=UPI003A998E37
MYWGVEQEWRKGPWTVEEDRLLVHHVNSHGEGRWNSVATLAGLKRNGKSCRLRWVNYLRPDLKRGKITPREEAVILDLHARWGNRWSTIARSLPGRTDNEIKNYWRTHFKKKSETTLVEPTKLKTRLLKRQKFQQAQRQQLQLQQYEVDMKKIMLLLEESENKVGYMTPTMMDRQQENMYEEQQSSQYPMLSQLYGSTNYVLETPMNEDFGLWEGLWNLDDNHGNLCAAKAS